jgi:hypothetical protein
MRISFETLIIRDLEKQLSCVQIGEHSDNFLKGFRYISYEFLILLIGHSAANLTEELLEFDLQDLIKSIDNEVQVTHDIDFWQGYNAGKEYIQEVMLLNFGSDSIAA